MKQKMKKNNFSEKNAEVSVVTLKSRFSMNRSKN